MACFERTASVTLLAFGGARFRRGYSEVIDAYRGPCTALSSLEKHNRE